MMTDQSTAKLPATVVYKTATEAVDHIMYHRAKLRNEAITAEMTGRRFFGLLPPWTLERATAYVDADKFGVWKYGGWGTLTTAKRLAALAKAVIDVSGRVGGTVNVTAAEWRAISRRD